MAVTPKAWANDAAGATPIVAPELIRMDSAVTVGDVVGLWYTGLGNVSSGFSASLNRLYYVPVWTRPGTIDRVAVNVSVAAAAASGGVVRIGVYSNVPATSRPGSLLADAGTVSTEAVGARELPVTVTSPGGLLWLASVAQVVTATFTATTSSDGQVGVGTPAPGTLGSHGYYESLGAGASLPAASAGASLTQGGVSHIRAWYRVGV